MPGPTPHYPPEFKQEDVRLDAAAARSHLPVLAICRAQQEVYR